MGGGALYAPLPCGCVLSIGNPYLKILIVLVADTPMKFVFYFLLFKTLVEMGIKIGQKRVRGVKDLVLTFLKKKKNLMPFSGLATSNPRLCVMCI